MFCFPGVHVTDHKPRLKKKPRVPKPAKQAMRPDQRIVPNVTSVHHRFIGKLVAEWSKLEAALEDLIWCILRLQEEDGRTLTKRTDTEAKITILRSLGPRHLSGEMLSKLLDAVDEADHLREDRNFVVHGIWATLQPNGVPIAMSIRPKSEPNKLAGQTYSNERMRDLIDTIIETKRDIIWVYASLLSSRDKSP